MPAVRELLEIAPAEGKRFARAHGSTGSHFDCQLVTERACGFNDCLVLRPLQHGFVRLPRLRALQLAAGIFCAFHADPQRAVELGRMGGRKNRRYASPYEASPVRPPQTAREVKDLLAEALAGIHAGRLEPKVVSVMAYVGTALLNAMKTTDMEERIAALERAR